MDRFLDEQENPQPIRDRSASPITSLIYCDPKRQHALAAAAAAATAAASATDPTPADIAAALQMVQEVVDPEKVFNNVKLNPELNSPPVLLRSEIKEKRQHSDNQVHTASVAGCSGTNEIYSSSGKETSFPKYSNSLEPPEKCSKLDKRDKDVISETSSVVECVGASLPAMKHSLDKQKTANGNDDSSAVQSDSEKSNRCPKKTELCSVTDVPVSSIEKDETNCEPKKSLEAVVK